MYELKKIGRYLRVNLLVPGPRLIKKRIYRASVSQRLRNAALYEESTHGETSALQYTTLRSDKKLAAADPRLRPRSH
jgi:hypothetical protein